MGDIGDYWREHRQHKRRVRNHWNECPHCAVSFGGNGTLVPPGENCHHCGWESPGKRGDDLKSAEQDRITMEMEAEEKARRKVEGLKKRTCPDCGKTLKTQRAMHDHRRGVHGWKSNGDLRKARAALAKARGEAS